MVTNTHFLGYGIEVSLFNHTAMASYPHFNIDVVERWEARLATGEL